MGRTTPQKAKRKQKRDQDHQRLLQGIQDAGGILPPDIPDTPQGGSQPALQESAVFILHQDLELSAGDLRPSAIRSDWAVPVGATHDTLADRVDILKHYLKVLPQEKEPDPSTAAPVFCLSHDFSQAVRYPYDGPNHPGTSEKWGSSDEGGS
ncbi:hypothetical protein JCM11641_006576 [Rhodosporidiobolus odoratus]